MFVAGDVVGYRVNSYIYSRGVFTRYSDEGVKIWAFWDGSDTARWMVAKSVYSTDFDLEDIV